MSTITAQDTPMLRQYKSIKAEHQDSILFFRLGDFYEMFLEDANIAAKALSLTLTARGKDANRIPMCGVPYHAADTYIQRLVNQGHKVAICEQVEEATVGKGITKREVVKIWTPGTMDQSEKTDDNTYLLAFSSAGKSTLGYAFLDIHTGDYRLGITTDSCGLQSLLERTQAKELILPIEEKWHPPQWFNQLHENMTETPLTTHIPYLTSDRANEELCQKLGVQSLTAFGIEETLFDALPACWALIDYALMTQKHDLQQLTQLTPEHHHAHLFLDRPTIKNLELVHNLQDGTSHNTLFETLNHCKTALGTRALKERLRRPFAQKENILQTQSAITSLKADLLSREEIRECLHLIYDLEKLSSRIASREPAPKDLIALKNSLKALLPLCEILPHLNTGIPKEILDFFDTLKSIDSPFQIILQDLESKLLPEPSTFLRDGNVMNPNAHPELAELLASFKTIKTWIQSLEPTERQATGIKSLKVGFNKVFGYYFEIPNSWKDSAPEHYIRKQTLSNAERYVTPELKEKESILLTGEDKQKALEAKLFQNLVENLTPHIPFLQTLSRHIAQLDLLQSLATAAQKYNYVCPSLSETPQTLIMQAGRHPILENNPNIRFIANDIEMTNENHRFVLLTGPNMAGKSTLMRQIALIIVMAQIGSYVPAETFEWSLVDRLYTRIGALDNLYAGQSTFMVEMLETASILNTASPQSLILLDEIGRGTSTYDGMSIACAVSEYIHQTLQARTLFATHYHELTALETQYPGISNFNMTIQEIDGKLIFTHKLNQGTADKSYGVHVATMAGLPDQVIGRAKSHLKGFDEQGMSYIQKESKNQLSLF